VGHNLLLVDDERPGSYFVVPLPTPPLSRIALDAVAERALGVEPRTADDLEGIGALADGRVVVLSENERTLVANGVVVARYPESEREVDGRGLEGLAVRALPDSTSVVAVVWEGGWVDTSSAERGGSPRLPRVLVHTVPPGAAPDSAPDMRFVTLHVPLPEPATSRSVFRVPDLVWHPVGGDPAEVGFIALLNSWERTVLQRFSAEGEPIGEPLDLKDVATLAGPACEAADHACHNLNWEGLAWLEEGRRLILVDDKGSKRRAEASPYLAVVELPPDW
jgi:hypothetical protein